MGFAGAVRRQATQKALFPSIVLFHATYMLATGLVQNASDELHIGLALSIEV